MIVSKRAVKHNDNVWVVERNLQGQIVDIYEFENKGALSDETFEWCVKQIKSMSPDELQYLIDNNYANI